MLNKRLAMAVAAVFAFFFITDFVIHGHLLKGLYMQTASVWRSEAQMQHHMGFMMAEKLLSALLLCVIFTYGRKGKDVMEGVRYGLLLGGLIAAQNFMWYAVLPIPQALLLAWIAGCLFQYVGAGVIVALMYKPARGAAR